MQQPLQRVQKSRAAVGVPTASSKTVESVSGDMEEELLVAIMYFPFSED